ncbi:MAG: methyltransferase domain-containing protein [Anaerolineae bacterium]|nr:methyltransferase domain-containing protein [Anaerolineae bacterium]
MSDNVIQDLGLNLEALRFAIQEEYGAVALNPQQGFHFHTGRPLAQMLGYRDAWLEGIPETSIESFAGTGNPFSIDEIQVGEQVVDVACGAGIDSLIAAKMVGTGGRVIGVDMTPAMLAKARRGAAEAQFANVEFREGYAESLPVPDGWADIVISNGALNLMPDKAAALKEMARVLKPGGRLQIGDLVVQKAVPTSAKQKIELWTGCIAGAVLETELYATVVKAGFVGFEITWQDVVFDGAPQQSSAANFGTLGINFRARKAVNQAEWDAALAALPVVELAEAHPVSIFGADAFYDAGDKGCADGPLDEIAALLHGLEPGQTLEVRATEPSVATDLPAWCRLAKHELVTHEGDRYLVRRK